MRKTHGKLSLLARMGASLVDVIACLVILAGLFGLTILFLIEAGNPYP